MEEGCSSCKELLKKIEQLQKQLAKSERHLSHHWKPGPGGNNLECECCRCDYDSDLARIKCAD